MKNCRHRGGWSVTGCHRSRIRSTMGSTWQATMSDLLGTAIGSFIIGLVVVSPLEQSLSGVTLTVSKRGSDTIWEATMVNTASIATAVVRTCR